MDSLTSFVVGGALIIIVYLLFQLFLYPNLLKIFLKLKFINLVKLLPQLIILVIFSTILSFIIFLNTSYNNNASIEVRNHIGATDSIIYSRAENQTFNDKDISKIYSFASQNYDKFLPISVIKSDKININQNEIKDIILVNYNLISSQTYLENISNTNFDTNKVTIAKSLSEKSGIKTGDSIKLTFKDKIFEIRIDQVQEDNGLIGYDFTVPSRLKQFSGSIFLPKEKFLEISGFSNDSNFNQILLQSTSDSYSGEINSKINTELIKYDKNLILENVNLPYLQRILGNFQGLNISQIILLLFILPAITLIILQLYFDKKYLINAESKIGILKIQGISDREIQGILNYLILFKSILSSVLGLLFGLFLVGIFGQFSFFENFGLRNLPKTSFDFNTILFSFSAIFIVTFLINYIWNYSNSRILVKLKNFSQIKIQKSFQLKNNSLALMIFFGTIIGIYYLNSDFVKDQNFRFIGNFYILQTMIAVIGFLFSRYFVKNKKIIISTISIMIFLINILPLTIFKNYFQINPFLIAFNWIFLAYNIIIVYLIFIDILSKSLQFTKVILPKNIIFSNGFIDKFRNYILIFVLILQFFFFTFALINYISGQVKFAQTDKTNSFDIYITDEQGITNSEDINKIVQKYTDLKTSNFLAYGNAEFKNLSVKDLKNYEKEKFPNLNPDAFVSDYMAFVSNDAFKEYNFEKREEFFNSNQYFLLTSNFDSGDGLKLNIQKDDFINFEINGIEFKRKFLGYIDSNSQLKNGIYLSKFDYDFLHLNQNLNLNQNFAFNINDEIKDTANFKKDIVDTGISSLLIRNELVNGTLNLVDQMLFGLNFFLWIAIIMIIFICYFIYRDLIYSRETLHNQGNLDIYKNIKYTFSVISTLIILSLAFTNFYIFPELLRLIHDNITIKYLENTKFTVNTENLLTIPGITILVILIVNILLLFIFKNLNANKKQTIKKNNS